MELAVTSGTLSLGVGKDLSGQCVLFSDLSHEFKTSPCAIWLYLCISKIAL